MQIICKYQKNAFSLASEKKYIIDLYTNLLLELWNSDILMTRTGNL